MRQIVLDTETTGLDVSEGHKMIEIACVELVDRRLTGKHYHQYINPERTVDQKAIDIHGISNEFLADKPLFSDIATAFIEFIDGSELIIHNAPFDTGFINSEMRQCDANLGCIEDYATIIDTLALARKKHPGQRNSLDALCRRYNVDNSQRSFHGALLDAELLADVYLLMTGGQTTLLLGEENLSATHSTSDAFHALSTSRPSLVVLKANEDELSAHKQRLQALDKASNGHCIWRSNV